MKITNKHNLPQAIVDAVVAIQSKYSKGDADFSVTELLRPPYMNKLVRLNEDKIEKDVSDLLWAVRGQALHYVLEQADGRGYKTEERLFTNIGQWRVSGQADAVYGNYDCVQDYKDTSVWAIKEGKVKPEWEQQLNVLAEIMRRERGASPGLLQIVAWLKDWKDAELMNAKRRNEYYSPVQIAVLDAPVWDSDMATDFIIERCSLHQQALDSPLDAVPPCTDKECWLRDSKWAVYKNSNKKATKLCDTEEEADQYIAGKKQTDKKNKWWKTFRKGDRQRCRRYCDAAAFCPAYREWKGGE